MGVDVNKLCLVALFCPVLQYLVDLSEDTLAGDFEPVFVLERVGFFGQLVLRTGSQRRSQHFFGVQHGVPVVLQGAQLCIL
jgi:hypothetical protein